MPSQTDLQFGQTAVAKGYISTDSLSRYLQICENMKQQGHSVSLAQLMMEQRALNQTQVSTILRQTTASGGATIVPSQPLSRRIGRYEIIEEIGRGGMGNVYKVRDTHLDRILALKVLLQDSQENAARFLREAQTTAHLDHPNIISLHDFGQEEGKNFFTMDFIKGKSLKDYKKNNLSSRKIAEIMCKVTEAIAYAHNKGVIHRDLKPANIMIDSKRNPIVMDFGLAKFSDSQQQLSQSGVVLGTLYYMPPEQAQGRISEIDHRSDIYALGAVIYELLTGHPPFTGATFGQVINQIINKEVIPPTTIKKSIPKDLETICLKALAKEKSFRYQTSKQMAEDLAKFVSGEKISSSAPGIGHRILQLTKKNTSATFAICLLFLLITGTIVATKISQINTLELQLKKAKKKLREKQSQVNVFVSKDHQKQKKSLRYVIKMGKRGMPVLNQILKNSKQKNRVFSELFKMGKFSLPILIALLENSSSKLTIAKSFGKIESISIFALVPLLNHKDKKVRENALIAIENLGPEVQKIAKNIEKLLTDTDPAVQIKAASLLTFSKIYTAKIIPVVQKSLRHKTFSIKEKAVSIAEKLGPQAKEIFPQVANALGDKGFTVKRAAIGAIAKIDPKKAVPELQKAIKKEKGSLKIKAIMTLWRIKKNHKKTVNLLTKELKSRSGITINSACEAIAEMGPKAHKTVDNLIDILNSKLSIWGENATAAKALGKMGPKAKKAVPHLIKALGKNNVSLQMQAAKALDCLDAKTALPTLIRLKKLAKSNSQVYLGSLNTRFITYLKKGIVNKEIQQFFIDRNFPLSNKVNIEEEEQKWLIYDLEHQQSYSLLCTGIATSISVSVNFKMVIEQVTKNIKK